MVNFSSSGIAITQRFFEVIDILIATKRIRGLQTFTKRHNIGYSTISTLRTHKESHVLKPEYIAYLCKDYNVSPEYIILGTGNIFIL